MKKNVSKPVSTAYVQRSYYHIQFSEILNELSITLGCSVIRFCQVLKVVRGVFRLKGFV